MSQKGFAPVIIILLVVASAIAFGVWSQSSQKNNSSLNLKTSTGEQEQKIGERKPIQEIVGQNKTDSLVASVVKTFCENFFKGPPALNDAGVIQAIDLLSQKATKSISTKGPSPSAALTQFVGVQDIPDQGYTIDGVSEEEKKAIVKTTWKYSGGPVNKIFNLVKENGDWKIDSIQ